MLTEDMISTIKGGNYKQINWRQEAKCSESLGAKPGKGNVTQFLNQTLFRSISHNNEFMRSSESLVSRKRMRPSEKKDAVFATFGALKYSGFSEPLTVNRSDSLHLL